MVANALIYWYDTGKRELLEIFPNFELKFPLSKTRLDAFLIRFSYDMERIYSVTASSTVRKFLLTIPYLRSNEHDGRHHPGCFKNGCECRYDFPRWIQEIFVVTFGPEQSKRKWFLVYGGALDLDAKGFTLVSDRGIPDVFFKELPIIYTLIN